jgi:NADH-quinone oxidoreductase subunit G
MATIFIDGRPYEVDGANNLLRACLSLGLDVPYFCWHPALGSVGACRQCAVKQFSGPDDKRGRLVMSCMTQSTDKTYISIDDAEARAFRKSVVEWLMTNHPHDCPVCEEGGHCHLQDMTVMVAHNKRRYRFTKRTHQNQDLGPFINHEMNRCIACYRCVRYYNDYADGDDLGVFGAHDNLYFGRESDGVFKSEFSGNLIEVCPTGVFTDRTHSEHYNRKWDMQFAPSVCQQCGVGCNTSPGERYGELRRIENRYHGEINHYFLCDRGRFGHGYVNRKDRPRQPFARNKALHNASAVLEIMNPDEAVDSIANNLREAFSKQRVIGIGSPRASIEANYALRDLVGADNFYCGIGETELKHIHLALDILQTTAVRTPALREMESCDAVFVLGEDVTQTAPRVALALRQAVKTRAVKMAAASKIPDWQIAAIQHIGQKEKSPLFIGSFCATRLDDVAEACLHAPADDLARLGFAVAHAIDDTAPEVGGLSPALAEQARRIAQALLAAEKPLVISGTGAASEAIMHAAANVAQALHNKGKAAAALALCVPEVNSLGVAMLTQHKHGKDSVEAALRALTDNQADAVIIVENDLYRRAQTRLVDAAFSHVPTVVAIDHQSTMTVENADYVLPAASFAEGDGTMVNMEGRAQRYFQLYNPAYYDPSCNIKESWRWIYALHTSVDQREINWTTFDEITYECAGHVPSLANIVNVSPDASYRVKGLKIARAPRRYSGRTAMRANISVHEPRVSQDEDSALTFSMEGYVGPYEDASFVPFAWAPGWNSPQAWTKFQDEVGGHLLSGDSGVRLLEPASRNAAYFSDIPAAFVALDDRWQPVPLHHIFGSEELSSRASATETLLEQPYVGLNPEDAEHLRAHEGALLKIQNAELSLSLVVRILKELPKGTVGLPVGLNGMPVISFDKPVQLSTGARV